MDMPSMDGVVFSLMPIFLVLDQRLSMAFGEMLTLTMVKRGPLEFIQVRIYIVI